MMNGWFPFKGENDDELYTKIVKGEFLYPYKISKGVRLLIQKLLVT